MTTGIPEVGPLPVVTLHDVVDATTSHGVRLVAVRRPHIPLVQLRLHVPLGALALREITPLRLLPKMLFAGTDARSGSEVAAALQHLGMLADAAADADYLSISSTIPAAVFEEGLRQIADIVAAPAFPQREVVGERDRVVQEVLQEAADPVSIATRLLSSKLFPHHPYSDPLPAPGTVSRIGRTRLLRLHDARVRPRDSVLVLVGDVDLDRVAAVVEDVFGTWRPAPTDDVVQDPTAPTAPPMSPDPPTRAAASGAVTLLHRPGAVQSNLRLGSRCIGRDDPGFASLLLAVMVFGGNFTSRLTQNLRERHGYTYSPRAGVEEHRFASSVVVKTEVGVEFTAASLTEVHYELSKMSTSEVGAEELESARRYVAGVLAMASGTQAGLASLLGSVVSHGLEPAYVERFTRELASVDVGAVYAASARYLGPMSMTTVVVGDADLVAGSLSPLGEVTVVSSSG